MNAPANAAEAATGDLARFAAWLDRHGVGEGPLEDVRLLTGGTQNILMRFTRSGQGFVLRRPPEHIRAGSNETMRREARVLAALEATAVPVPRLAAACSDESEFGYAFYVMEEIPGFSVGNGIPESHYAPDVQHAMGLALAGGALALGAVDYRAVGLADFGKVDNYLGRQVGRWRRQIDSYSQYAGWPGPSALPDVDEIGAWLDRHCPQHFDPGIIHGDYHIGNVLFAPDGPALAAIVDWELATVGDPLIDLGWLVATWPDENGPVGETLDIQPWLGFPTASEIVDHYRTRSTRDLSAVDWYVVLACYKLGIILEGTHARASAGLADPEVGKRLHDTTLGLFERARRRIR